MFINLCILLISCLFYSTGSFGFLNIFGIRREVQIFLILGPLLLSPVIFKNFPKLLKKPIFLLVLTKFIVECILNQRFINMLDGLTSALVVGILLSLRKEYSDKILRLILMLTIFIISMFFIVIYFVEVPNFVMKITQFLNLINKQYTPFNKYSLGVARFGAIKNYLAITKQYPFFGSPLKAITTINLPMGLLLYSHLHYGIFGLVLMVAIWYDIFKHAIYCFNLYKGIIGLMAAVLYGTFVQVLCFSNYGWTGASSFFNDRTFNLD